MVPIWLMIISTCRAAIHSLQQSHPNLEIAIYCGEGSTASSLVQLAKTQFNLQINPTFRIVPLKSYQSLLPGQYKRFTMVRQALASIAVAIEGLRQFVPELWVDTTGWAFPYPLIRMLGTRVAAYVHYPTISTNMLMMVHSRNASFNNETSVANSTFKSSVKLAYYQIFALIYGFVGSCANVVMVNSSWTRGHIESLWWHRRPPARVYPPCDTTALQALPLDRRLKRPYIISVAQFRPEKDHETQLRAFALAREQVLAGYPGEASAMDAVLSAKLQLVGGCRGQEDAARIEKLKILAESLNLNDDCLEFRVNVPFDELKSMLGNAVIGLHTMKDEHFGISVVEYMAAGVVPIAHNSGGPKEDIVVPEAIDDSGVLQKTGFLCSKDESYAEAIINVLSMSQNDRLKIGAAARKRANLFSDERFGLGFMRAIEPVLPVCETRTSNLANGSVVS